MNLSLVIPVFNEEENIEEVVLDYQSKMTSIEKLTYEIIIVDDCSRDKTSEILEGLSDIRVLRNNSNSGYGFSIKKGIRESKYNLIMITDGDGSYPSEDAAELVKSFSDEDMLIGSRTGSDVSIPLLRRPAKFFLNNYASFLTSYHIPDVNSGARIFKVSLYEKYKQYLPDAFSFTTTITLSAINNGHNVRFLPINYLKRGGVSKIRPIRDFVNFIILITKISLYFNPLKIFTIISSFIFLLSISIFAISLKEGFPVPDITLVSLIMTSVIIFCMGLLADLVNKRIN